MPTYVYKFVDSGETIEVQQGFTDDTLTEFAHPETGEVLPVKKVFTPVGVTFKGSGFFKTDNRGKTSSSTNGSGSTNGASSSSGDSSSGGSSSGDSSSGKSSSGGSSESSKPAAPTSNSSISSSSSAST
jgi:predicted nucleic acid-binding Zn ribbon protein